MHFEVLVEDQSGKKMLEVLMPKIIDSSHTYKIIAYKGIGHLPKKMRDTKKAHQRILLENLPKLLKGYGKTFTGYGLNYPCIVILVCDLDEKNYSVFIDQLQMILNSCEPKPETRFCIAIEEMEAWLLGDISAIKAAYPHALDTVLNNYQNDSICGTWEKLADAIHPGGSRNLISKGWQITGAEKSIWAAKITPHMDIENNFSPSFNAFKNQIELLAK